MRLSTRAVATGMTVIILGGILVLMGLGFWRTESRKIPARFSGGEFSGLSNPADIKGSYTFDDIANSFGVSVPVLAQAYAVDTSTKPAGQYTAKDIETIYSGVAEGSGEVGTDSVRWFVALYLGLPFTPESDTLLPVTALHLLRDEHRITGEVLADVQSRSVAPSPVAGDAGQPAGSVVPAEDRVINGGTTFADLLSWGLAQERIEEVLGVPMGNRTDTIRNHARMSSLEYASVRVELQRLVDGL